MEDEKKLGLIDSLNFIQCNLNAPKNLYNKFGNYSYRSAESILEALKPLLCKTGCVLKIDDSVEMVGNRIYIKATATLTKGSESISTSAFAREAEIKKGMDDSQVTGATSSYARKYALNGLFAIDDTKDTDTNEYQQVSNAKPENKELSNAKPENKELETALFAVKNAKDTDSLKQVWNAFPSLQKDKEFISEVNDRKSELQ